MNKFKNILLISVVFFIGCVPDAPDYKRNIDETMLAVSCGLRPGDTTHFVYVENLYECSDSAPGDCGDLSPGGLGVDSALVQISIQDSIYVGVQSGRYYINYKVDFSILPGDTVDLIVIHPDYEPAWATIVVPGKVNILQLNNIINENNVLEFEWTSANNAIGYDSHLYVVGINDTSDVRYKLEDGFDKNENTTWDDKPSKRKYYSTGLAGVIDQISFFIEVVEIPENFYEVYDSIYLQLDVWALDEAYYNTFLSQYNPDEYSGFSAPLTQYSNIENGVGVFGSYWITKSELINITEIVK